MSKVAIQGNASGTGTFTIAAPNSNTDRTLTLPDEAGTVLTSASSIPVANLDSVVGITTADNWETTSGFTPASTGVAYDINANLARPTASTAGYLGTGMSQSSGIFTYPETGIYYVSISMSFYGAGDRAVQVIIQGTTDGGSNWTQQQNAFGGVVNVTGTCFGHATTDLIVDVTNTANVKTKFSYAVFTSSGTSVNDACMTFIRLGDT